MYPTKAGFGFMLVGLLLVDTLSSPAQGQGFVGGRGRFGDGVSRLLKNEHVQKEIAFTADQKSEFLKLVEADRVSSDSDIRNFDFVEFQKLPEAEQAKRREALSKKTAERTKQFDEKIKTLLNPDQWTRLNQIRIQQEGVRSLARDEVQKQLGLTAEQLKKIKALVDKGNEIGGGRNPLDMTPEERRKAREENEARRQAFEKDMAAVLNAEQTAAWTKLKGTAFEIPR